MKRRVLDENGDIWLEYDDDVITADVKPHPFPRWHSTHSPGVTVWMVYDDEGAEAPDKGWYVDFSQALSRLSELHAPQRRK